MLDSYREPFARLHTNRGPYPWTALTCYQAPHKPLLLLAVLELVASGDITPDLLVLTPQLVATFQDYWRAIPDLEEPTGDPVLPFRSLDHEEFWHRVRRAWKGADPVGTAADELGSPDSAGSARGYARA